jgi:hypothetical protein
MYGFSLVCQILSMAAHFFTYKSINSSQCIDCHSVTGKDPAVILIYTVQILLLYKIRKTTINEFFMKPLLAPPRSLSPISGWIIQYKTESKSIWDGHETREEFLMMLLR